MEILKQFITFSQFLWSSPTVTILVTFATSDTRSLDGPPNKQTILILSIGVITVNLSRFFFISITKFYLNNMRIEKKNNNNNTYQLIFIARQRRKKNMIFLSS